MRSPDGVTAFAGHASVVHEIADVLEGPSVTPDAVPLKLRNQPLPLALLLSRSFALALLLSRSLDPSRCLALTLALARSRGSIARALSPSPSLVPGDATSLF